MSDASPAAVKSADRVLDLLELLAAPGPGLTHAGISDALAIPKSSLTVLLRNLMDRGYLAYEPLAKTYRLGPQFARLAQRTSRSQDLSAIVEPLLADLTAATGETSALNVVDGDRARVAASADSPQRLVYQMRKGDLAPLYATSGGKAILAHFDAPRLDAYLARVALEPITPKTITSEPALRRQLDAIRAGALADVFDEYTPGIVGVATPILSSDGDILGAVNVAMPSLRYDAATRARVDQALRAVAATLRRRLGDA